MMFIYKTSDTEGILHGPECKYLIRINTRKRRLVGVSSRGKEQFIVRLFEYISRFQIPHGHLLFLRMNGRHLMVYVNLHIKSFQKILRGLKRQIILIRDHTANIVGQTAVGIADISGTLKNNDLRRFIQTPYPGGSRSPARNSSDNYNLHRAVT